MILRFHFVLSDLHPGIEDLMCKRLGAKMLFCVPRNGKVLLRSSASCSKKDVPWKWGVGGLWNLSSQAKIFFDFVI